MLYIRTQNRMALVPLKGVISIYKDKIINLKEMDDIRKYNLRLHGETMNEFNIPMFENLTPEAQAEYDKRKKPDIEPVRGYEISINKTTLGTYKSKERALEVLDDIEKYVLGKIVVPTSTYEKREDLAIGSSAYVNVKSENIISLPSVYQMPKEEE